MASLSSFGDGNGGIGQGGVERAKAAGWTDAQINAAIKSEGLTAGPVIQSQGYGVGSGPAPSPSPSSSSYDPRAADPRSMHTNKTATPGASQQFLQGPNVTPGYIGLESVNQMRAAGYTDVDIMNQINMDGLKMGEKALASLRPELDEGSGQYYNYNQYQGGTMGNVFAAGPGQITPKITGAGSTPGYLGMTTVNQLRSEGWSDEAIRHQAGIEGLKLGTVAEQSLSKDTWQDRNEREKQQRLAESNKNPVAPGTTNSEFADFFNTPAFSTVTDTSTTSTAPQTSNNAIYDDPLISSMDPWDFEYGANNSSAIYDDSYNSFKPAPLPTPKSKKPSIFEQVMNASPAPLASPQTFANVIANS